MQGDEGTRRGWKFQRGTARLGSAAESEEMRRETKTRLRNAEDDLAIDLFPRTKDGTRLHAPRKVNEHLLRGDVFADVSVFLLLSSFGI